LEREEKTAGKISINVEWLKVKVFYLLLYLDNT